MNEYIYSWFICRNPTLFDLSKGNTSVHELVSIIHRQAKCKENIADYMYHTLFGDVFNETQLVFDKEIPIETFISSYKGIPNLPNHLFQNYEYVSKAREKAFELINENKEVSFKKMIETLVACKFQLIDIFAALFEIAYLYTTLSAPSYENIDIITFNDFDLKIMNYLVKNNFDLDLEFIVTNNEFKENPILKQLVKINDKKLEEANDYYYIQNKPIQDIKRRSELPEGEIKLIFQAIGLTQLTVSKKVEWRINKTAFGILVDFINEDMEFTVEKDTGAEKLTYGGCYLLQKDGDYMRKNNRFKIGKAKNLLSRLNDEVYRDAHIFCTRYVENVNDCEREIITTFTKLFKLIDICDEQGCHGKEYFEGNLSDMITIFNMICSKYC